MFRPGRPSSSRNRHAESRGRAALALLLGGGAVLLLAAGGVLGLRRGGSAAGGYLISLGPDAGDGGRETAAPGRRLALVGRQSSEPRILTRDFRTADDAAVSFDAARVAFAGRLRAGEAPELWEIEVKSGSPRRITAGHGGPAEPVYLPDGRILFTDRLPDRKERSPEPRALYSCAADGSDLVRLTFGEGIDSRPRLLPDGRVAFERRLPAGPDGESLSLVIHPDGTGIARHADRETLAEDAAAPGGAKPPGSVDRIPLTPRPAPPVLTSVVKRDAAEWPSGTLLCLDVYESQLPELTGLNRGAIRRVKVVSADAGGGPAATRVAEGPVQPDGSFLVEVPADVPLRLVLLDADGKEVARQDFPLWVRPNENRGCVGCHEGPGQAPDNRQPMAVTHPPESLFRALTQKDGDDAE